ncbi:hypothetical protein DL769_006469 [Monosporascus sp. CRB-8-3]|nr:hypothetical protein DL769_006469 [Monosporascus sp. CRB-8-3]
MDPPSGLSPDLELDGFMLAPVKEPALSALQQPVEGIDAIDGLAGSYKAALEGHVYHNLLNLLIIALKLKHLWKRRSDRENYEGYIQAIVRDWGIGSVGSSKFLLSILKNARKKFLAQFEQELKDWRHEAGILDARREELNHAEDSLKAEGDEATLALRRRVEELQNRTPELEENLISHEKWLSWTKPSNIHGHTAAGNIAEYYNTMKDIMITSKKPWVPFSLPHNPLAEEKIQAIPTKDVRACEDAQDCEKLAQSLEDEIKTRAILDKRQGGGAISQKIDRKDIRLQLEGMSLESGYAIAAMLVSVRRSRHIPHITIDSFVWGELCEEACNILVFGRSLGQSDSFQAFLERLVAWSQRLLMVQEDEAQKVRLGEGTKDFSIHEVSDADIEIILG